MLYFLVVRFHVYDRVGEGVLLVRQKLEFSNDVTVAHALIVLAWPNDQCGESPLFI